MGTDRRAIEAETARMAAEIQKRVVSKFVEEMLRADKLCPRCAAVVRSAAARADDSISGADSAVAGTAT